MHAVSSPWSNRSLPIWELALGAATAAVSRAGASSLAEIAAVRLPSLLVPYPAAADNASIFITRKLLKRPGAARLLEQKIAAPEKVAALLRELVEDAAARANNSSRAGAMARRRRRNRLRTSF